MNTSDIAKCITQDTFARIARLVFEHFPKGFEFIEVNTQKMCNMSALVTKSAGNLELVITEEESGAVLNVSKENVNAIYYNKESFAIFFSGIGLGMVDSHTEFTCTKMFLNLLNSPL